MENEIEEIEALIKANLENNLFWENYKNACVQGSMFQNNEPVEIGIDGLPTDKNIVTLDKHGKILQGL